MNEKFFFIILFFFCFVCLCFFVCHLSKMDAKQVVKLAGALSGSALWRLSLSLFSALPRPLVSNVPKLLDVDIAGALRGTVVSHFFFFFFSPHCI